MKEPYKYLEISGNIAGRIELEKADQLKLDDSDVEIISKRLEKVI